MSALISKKEIEDVLSSLSVNKYYINIDMNGGLALTLPPEFAEKMEKIEEHIIIQDKGRTPDDIYRLNEVLYPFKYIDIDDDDDEETLKKFDQQGFFKSYYSQQLNTWKSYSKSEKKSRNRTPCVTFYSYKGGVGRSTALAIVARLLAKEGITVAVIDLDLEAPGLNSLLLTHSKPSPFGVVDYLYHAPWIRDNIDEKNFLQRYMVREEIPIKNKKAGQLYVMAAGGTQVHNPDGQELLFDGDIELVLEPHYLQKLSYIDVDLYMRGSANVFEMLIEDVSKYTKADIILLDARTGLSNVSGLLLNHHSDIISIHIQDNWQNREGIKLILDSINEDRLKNMIWSNTKVVRGDDHQKELERLILHEIKDREITDCNDIDIKLHKLPYDPGIEDVTAYELKRYIETDRISVLYKDLTDSIIGLSDLSKKLPYHLSSNVYKQITKDLKKLGNLRKNVPYISQRFLNKDYEIFVGFPGSGKKTFHKYMLEQHHKELTVMDYEDFLVQDLGAHEVLSHSVFLNWSYEEATQAVCKWMFQSKALFEWLENKVENFEDINIEDLENMRDNPKYELPEKFAEFIVELIFQRNTRLRLGLLGWQRFFSYFIHRDKHVLPGDLMLAVQIHFQNLNLDMRINSMSSFTEIGIKKKEWLKNYNENLLNLIMICNSIRFIRNDIDIREKYLAMNKAMDFDKVLREGIKMGIFITDLTSNEIYLSPVYRLIKPDREILSLLDDEK